MIILKLSQMFFFANTKNVAEHLQDTLSESFNSLLEKQNELNYIVRALAERAHFNSSWQSGSKRASIEGSLRISYFVLYSRSRLCHIVGFACWLPARHPILVMWGFSAVGIVYVVFTATNCLYWSIKCREKCWMALPYRLEQNRRTL